MDIKQKILEFLQNVESRNVEIYNEFSLQHELGIYLRNNLQGCKIQFEKNVSYFNLLRTDFEKKEIDIAIFSSDIKLAAIELKYPRNGQVPETMFSFCKDILFLEQLKKAGFEKAYFLVVVDHTHFYSGNNVGIYSLFRNGKLITGQIVKPTGSKDHNLNIEGEYTANWVSLFDKTKYCLIEVDTSR